MVFMVNQPLGQIYRFAAEMASLPAILTQLEALGCLSGGELVKKATIAIEELFTNSVCHGVRAAGDIPDVGLAVAQAPGQLHVRYEDHFQAFDPFYGLDATHDQAGLSVAERPVGGLGRLLVRGLAHQATYTRVGAVNRVDLYFVSQAVQ